LQRIDAPKLPSAFFVDHDRKRYGRANGALTGMQVDPGQRKRARNAIALDGQQSVAIVQHG
jgi:hypothetical protein